MSCYCDYSYPDFYVDRMVKAKKNHRCDECGRTILAGEKYEYVSAVWEGDFSTCKTCDKCLELRQYTKAHVPCFCWQHGNVIQDAIDTLQEYAHEAPGLLFGGYRRYLAIYKPRQPASNER
jgi:hypothetical protein